MTALTERQTLRKARAVISSRGERRDRGDLAYATYSGCLLAAIAIFPILRFIVLGLADPNVSALTHSARSTGFIALAGSVLIALALLIGPIRGPAVPSPFLSQFLLGSPIARRLSLRRPYLWSSGIVSVVLVLTALLATIAHSIRTVTVDSARIGAAAHATDTAAQATGVALADPSTSVTTAALLLFSAFAFSILTSIAWLLGQSAPRWATTLAAAGVLAIGAVAAFGSSMAVAVTPWGWLALSWRGVITQTAEFWAAGALALLIGAVAAVPALLNNISGTKTMAQARRWQTTGMLLRSGDASGAAGTFRPQPRRGRRMSIRFAGPLPIVVFTRDLVAIMRFPTRLVVGSFGLALAGWLIAVSGTAPEGIRWALAVPAALVAFLSTGAWCDGLRNSAANAGTTALYGWRLGHRTLAHAVAPLIAAVAFGVVGALIATGSAASVGWWMLVALFTVIVRVYDSAKGPLPILLLMPVVTPVGDLSILNVAIWQADALLLAVAIAGGLTLAFWGGVATAPVWLGAAALVVALLTWRRLRALSVPA